MQWLQAGPNNRPHKRLDECLHTLLCYPYAVCDGKIGHTIQTKTLQHNNSEWALPGTQAANQVCHFRMAQATQKNSDSTPLFQIRKELNATCRSRACTTTAIVL